MITVASFTKAEDAYLLRSRLQAAGIPAFIQNEYISQMYWLYTNAVGGVTVEIDESDREAAQELLTNTSEERTASITCPFCDSTDTEWQDWSRRLTFFFVLLCGWPTPVSKSRRHCRSCGEEWNEWERPDESDT